MAPYRTAAPPVTMLAANVSRATIRLTTPSAVTTPGGRSGVGAYSKPGTGEGAGPGAGGAGLGVPGDIPRATGTGGPPGGRRTGPPGPIPGGGRPDGTGD